MPATTPNLALPYPVAADTADVPRDIQALAVKLDIVAGGPLVTTLPASPADGQECYFVADSANGVIWHLRYRAAATGSFKWEFVGGPGLYAEGVGQQTVAGTGAYVDLPGGPAVTLPLAGDYDITIGTKDLGSTGNGQAAYMSYQIGAAVASDNDGIFNYIFMSAGARPDVSVSISRTRRKPGLGAVALTAKYKTTSGTLNARDRMISATPVRVG